MMDMKDMDNMKNENCIPYETPIKPDGLARAYVPNQIICGYFEPVEGLKKGTIFPGLYSQYK